MNQLRADLPPLPHFMRGLPVDERGYPVPWFVQWIDGKPEFRAMDQRKFVKAINERRCWTCGNALFREAVFVIGPMCAVNRVSGEPPNHRECALFAATACPFLSKPQMVRRTDGLPAERGKPAGIMIERNPGVTVLWYSRNGYPFEVPNGVLFKVGKPFRVEWYCRGRVATREEILGAIESGLPTLRDTARIYDGPEGERELQRQVEIALRLVPRAKVVRMEPSGCPMS
jgi:hypothetical protein